MDEEKSVMADPVQLCADRLAGAAAAIESALEKVHAQYASLNEKIDRIIAAVEKDAESVSASAEEKAAELKRMNRELQQVTVRKTLPAVVCTLLAKSGLEQSAQMEAGVVDRALQALTIEQRIAVKAELARAGLIA